MNSAARNFSRLPKTYAGLVALHMPRPIHDTVTYDNAVEVVHALDGHKLNHDQGDYLASDHHLVFRSPSRSFAVRIERGGCPA